MSFARWAAAAAAGLLLPLAAPRGEDFRETAAQNIEKHTGWKRDQTGDPNEEGSPFRKALKLKLKDRENQGKKKPKVIEYETPKLKADPDGLDDDTGEPIGYGKGTCEGGRRCPKGGYVVKYTALTKFSYDGPDEAHDAKGGGRPEWPRLRVEKQERDPITNEWKPVLDENGEPVFVDKTEEYKQYVAAQGAAQDPPQKAWKDGPDDPDGLYEFGQEPQEEDVTEEITFTFEEENQAQGEAFFRELSAAMAAGPVGAEQAILMGFSYQGPNIDYTIGSSKRVCFFGCFYLWDIRAGFALDFGLGLRAPAYSRLTGPFDPNGVLVSSMVAGTTYDFRSVIETARQGDWMPGDWGVDAYDGVHVNPYTDRGEGEANEFVMYFEFFAGAKVKILGVNVCPWCQYVEVDIDYSESFETPFGGGTRFPIPDVEFPIKDFNFGIVSLTVGLYVTPNFTSTDIGAITDAGVPVAHHASGVPETFQVAACIRDQDATHFHTVSLDEYRYHFNSFQVVLGAFLHFSVAGYGVWNPRFDFLTLDLSRALGTLGAYLPDHRNCNVAFQCTPAPANQGVALTTEVVDQSPPSTSLVLGGTRGNDPWWISDVTGTLNADDNPRGCGSGVATTWWGLAAPDTAGTSFVLSTEAVQTDIHFRSIDRDGNVEVPHVQEVRIDKTPPAISGAATAPPNARGWYKEDVTVHFVASDATSGVASVTPDTVLSAEAEDQRATGTAEDHAGLTSTYTVTGIDIDKTPPTVTIAIPSPTATYQNTDVIHLDWSVTDGLSGVFADGGTLDGVEKTDGEAVELIYLGGGHHVVRAFGTDNADNANAAEVTFLVDVDIDGLIAAVNMVCANDWVTKLGICTSLRAKALEAKASLALDLKEDARGQLGAFLNELEAQQDKSVLDPAYRLLRVDAEYVLVRYGLVPAI